MIAYLAGPIQHVTKSESVDWRRHLTRFLSDYGISTLDPTRNQHLKRFEDGTWDKKAIIELDIADINRFRYTYSLYSNTISWNLNGDLLHG